VLSVLCVVFCFFLVVFFFVCSMGRVFFIFFFLLLTIFFVVIFFFFCGRCVLPCRCAETAPISSAMAQLIRTPTFGADLAIEKPTHVPGPLTLLKMISCIVHARTVRHHADDDAPSWARNRPPSEGTGPLANRRFAPPAPAVERPPDHAVRACRAPVFLLV